MASNMGLASCRQTSFAGGMRAPFSLREEVDEDRDDAEHFTEVSNGPWQRRRRPRATPREMERETTGRTDLDGDERDDDLLEALRVAGGDGLLEELEHVLEDLDARVEQVDALRDLEVAPCGVVQRLQVRVRLSTSKGSANVSVSVVRDMLYGKGGTDAHPEHFLQIRRSLDAVSDRARVGSTHRRVEHRADRVDVRAQQEELADLAHDLSTLR